MVDIISVASAFSTSPGPRYRSEGKFSGQQFREEILEPLVEHAIENNSTFLIDLDGVSGYGVGFLEEVFGGFIRYSDIPEIVQIASPVMLKMGASAQAHPYAEINEATDIERVRRVSRGLECLQAAKINVDPIAKGSLHACIPA